MSSSVIASNACYKLSSLHFPRFALVISLSRDELWGGFDWALVISLHVLAGTVGGGLLVSTSAIPIESAAASLPALCTYRRRRACQPRLTLSFSSHHNRASKLSPDAAVGAAFASNSYVLQSYAASHCYQNHRICPPSLHSLCL